jgi:hypothetical protein
MDSSLFWSASQSPTRGTSFGEKKGTVQLRTKIAGNPTIMNNSSIRGRQELPLDRLRLLLFVLKKTPSHPIHYYERGEGVIPSYASLIAPCGHASAQAPQSMQASASIT